MLTIAFSWPLPVHLGTHVTGPIGGDTGVYIWNQWVFRHELLDEHHLPLFTHEIFSLTRPTNLSLHNYTIFQDVIALPLLSIFDVVTTFNVVYLLMIVLTGLRHVPPLHTRGVDGSNPSASTNLRSLHQWASYGWQATPTFMLSVALRVHPRRHRVIHDLLTEAVPTQTVILSRSNARCGSCSERSS